jgi:hypothetical protein
MLFYERCAPRPEDAEKRLDKACFLKYNSWVKRDKKKRHQLVYGSKKKNIFI